MLSVCPMLRLLATLSVWPRLRLLETLSVWPRLRLPCASSRAASGVSLSRQAGGSGPGHSVQPAVAQLPSVARSALPLPPPPPLVPLLAPPLRLSPPLPLPPPLLRLPPPPPLRAPLLPLLAPWQVARQGSSSRL